MLTDILTGGFHRLPEPIAAACPARPAMPTIENASHGWWRIVWPDAEPQDVFGRQAAEDLAAASWTTAFVPGFAVPPQWVLDARVRINEREMRELYGEVSHG